MSLNRDCTEVLGSCKKNQMLLQKNFEHIMLLTYAITIGILLIKIGNRRTIITRISPFIITIGLSVFLVRIGHQWTIVWSIGYAIIVRVVIASIANTVPIGVLLSGIWCFGTIVLTTFLLKINVYLRKSSFGFYNLFLHFFCNRKLYRAECP